jgi:plasmid replication initiation protein
MREFLRKILKKLLRVLEKVDAQQHTSTGEKCIFRERSPSKINKTIGKKSKITEIETTLASEKSLAIISDITDIVDLRPVRDVMALMDVPFLSLSKNRTKPIIYESVDKKKRVVISGHRDHFIASIYDWDIILVVAGKLQETINNGFDIPSRTIVISRHELLKALHKHDGKKQHKDLEKSLSRLKATLIDTTVGNNRGGCGFIDSWEYKERETNRDKQIIRITISEWLYELCCAQGNLLKTDSLYFSITSGLKRFLYRTARRHAGINGWEFSVERLYEKSGSESVFRLFKSQLKKAVIENNLPSYSLKWIVKNKQPFVLFKHKKLQTIDERVEEYEEKYGLIEEVQTLSQEKSP